MKNIHLTVLGVATLVWLPQPGRAGIDLGSAGTFAVLGNTTVTSTGNTVINGNLGLYPGSPITGFGPGIVNGTTYNGGSVVRQAANDALAAYTAILGETVNQNLSGQDLGGLTLVPGVYQFTSAAQLTGLLTLNAENNPNAQFIFQIGSTLTIADLAAVMLENGAEADNVFWQVGSSATIGDGSILDGSILAEDSITMDTGADLDGNALALTGAVNLDDNEMDAGAIPEAYTLWSLPSAASGNGALDVAPCGGPLKERHSKWPAHLIRKLGSYEAD